MTFVGVLILGGVAYYAYTTRAAAPTSGAAPSAPKQPKQSRYDKTLATVESLAALAAWGKEALDWGKTESPQPIYGADGKIAGYTTGGKDPSERSADI